MLVIFKYLKTVSSICLVSAVCSQWHSVAAHDDLWYAYLLPVDAPRRLFTAVDANLNCRRAIYTKKWGEPSPGEVSNSYSCGTVFYFRTLFKVAYKQLYMQKFMQAVNKEKIGSNFVSIHLAVRSCVNSELITVQKASYKGGQREVLSGYLLYNLKSDTTSHGIFLSLSSKEHGFK